jgi:hypothetical protein
MHRHSTIREVFCIIFIGVVLHGGSGDAFARLVEVTDCAGGAATEKARYVLTADVDCMGEPDPALSLPGGSVLELGGHTLSNGDVLCSGKCRIEGPGTISGGGVIGNDEIIVRRLTITGSPSNGVLAINAKGHARAWIMDSVINGNAMTGVETDRMAHIFRSRIIGNGRYGVAVSLQPFNDCTRGRIRSWGSEISGNGVDVACGTSEVCADVASCAKRGSDRPVLHRTPCDTSYELGSGMPGRSCSLCTLD